MVHRHVAVEEAHSVLGLDDGASSEEVKSAYKKLAMKTHPDKNLDMPDATQKFQEIGAAYNTLMRHFDNLTYGAPQYSELWKSDSSDDDYSDYDDSDTDDDLDYFIYVFERFLRGQFHGMPQFASEPVITHLKMEEQCQERTRSKCEEQGATRKRRAMEDEHRKERRQAEKERERAEAQERQKRCMQEKKERAEASKKLSAEKVRSQKEQAQSKRSAVFAAARLCNAEAVKKGIWESSVDAAGGEVKIGCESFVPQSPEDPGETLLHIAISHGNVELVQRLIDHNAEPDERNSAGLTPFHLALQKGKIPIVQYFFKNLPPKDSDYEAIYATPASTSLLQLAMESFEPELVWMVLENELASERQISDAWTSLCSDSKEDSDTKRVISNYAQLEEEIRNLLMSYGGFTPSFTPKKELFEVKTKSMKITNGGFNHKPAIDSAAPASADLKFQNSTLSASLVASDLSRQDPPVFSNGIVRQSNGRGQGRGCGRRRR